MESITFSYDLFHYEKENVDFFDRQSSASVGLCFFIFSAAAAIYYIIVSLKDRTVGEAPKNIDNFPLICYDMGKKDAENQSYCR